MNLGLFVVCVYKTYSHIARWAKYMNEKKASRKCAKNTHTQRFANKYDFFDFFFNALLQIYVSLFNRFCLALFYFIHSFALPFFAIPFLSRCILWPKLALSLHLHIVCTTTKWAIGLNWRVLCVRPELFNSANPTASIHSQNIRAHTHTGHPVQFSNIIVCVCLCRARGGGGGVYYICAWQTNIWCADDVAC